MSEKKRCSWCEKDAVYRRYHDEEWGTPVREDGRLFEFLILEGAQAGLSWRTILGKREGYRRAFAGFDPARVARFGEADVAALLADPAIVRNRRKIVGAVQNARAFLAVRAKFGTFSDYIWGFVDGRPIQNAWRDPAEVPARTPLSDAIAKDLKARGFAFVGSTIIYADMQATGMVNDHLVSCFRHAELGGPTSSFPSSPAGERPRLRP